MRHLFSAWPMMVFVITVWLSDGPANADPGKPVAVRNWGHGTATIETYWNLRIVIDPHEAWFANYGRPPVDLVIGTHPADGSRVPPEVTAPIVRAVDADGNLVAVDHVLDRPPNANQVTWQSSATGGARSDHAVTVRSIAAPGGRVMFLIQVDGVRVLHAGDALTPPPTAEQAAAVAPIDLLLLTGVRPDTPPDDNQLRALRRLEPRVLVPLLEGTHDPADDVPHGWQAGTAEIEVVRPVGNTVAIRQADGNSEPPCQVVFLRNEPWQMPNELADLFDRKESASRAAQQVFAPLRVDQMNFRPSNGTHTPRWNSEHLMGREIGFFSQIYAAIDPSLAHIELNPAQMPPDYVARHADWTGAEEARQIERVSAFTRRFAYLLDELDLDQPAPGSRWTPRGLLRQMERHYQEHTANVVKKFELSDWPP